MKIKVTIPQLNHLRHDFIYAIVYTTFDKKPRQISYQPSGIYHLDIEIDPARVFRSFDTVVMQFCERAKDHDVLTYTALIPVADCMSGRGPFIVQFFDAAQDRDKYQFRATCSCEFAPDEHPAIEEGRTLEMLLNEFMQEVNEYRDTFNAALDGYERVRDDLVSLILTTFRHRIGVDFPNVAFFNVSRDTPVAPYVLNYLLSMGCFGVGLSLLSFEEGCTEMARTGKTLAEAKDSVVLLRTVRQAIDMACCIPSVMTPYAYDTFVDGRDASVKNTERFSNMRVPSQWIENSGADCEEDGKQNGTMLYYMKHAVLDPGDAERFPYLAAVVPALQNSLPASSLMLVKSANLKEASKTEVIAVPINETTGHMCGKHLCVKGGDKLERIDLTNTDETGVERITYLEGTGAIYSSMEPYADAVAVLYKNYQVRVAQSPLAGMKQRPNMTRHKLDLHNALVTPNNFYVVEDTIYPIHEKVEDAAVYLCCDYQGRRGVPVADMVLPDGGAYLCKMPGMSERLKGLMEVMMDFQCPEFPLEITPIKPEIVKKVADYNAQMKKGDIEEAYCTMAFTENFHKLTEDRWKCVIEWINGQSDVVMADVQVFGEIFRTPVVIVRLFFKMG